MGMIEQGMVKETYDRGTARVAFAAGAQCARCHACIRAGDERYVEAANEAGAKTGDRVVVEIPQSTVARAAILVFIFPALAFLIGIAVAGMLGGSIFLLIGLLVISLADRFWRLKGPLSRIKQIIS